ncbi:hypothetical protein niasHT_034914 [Heterodera trifolii]|uniref:Uncharacterized protein n=1 Tax=Heterodera trifolii TaxID=157864 RepID=A0ABD2I696_9BILA
MHASHVVIVPSATDVPKLFQLMGVAPFAVKNLLGQMVDRDGGGPFERQSLVFKWDHNFSWRSNGRLSAGTEMSRRSDGQGRLSLHYCWAYILMEKLRPMSVKNHIVWAKDKEGSSRGDFFEEVTPELGIYGTLFGNISNGDVLYNAQLGHKLKTKLASENEGGIETGNSAYDSAYLVD